jgi:hypothetical protein
LPTTFCPITEHHLFSPSTITVEYGNSNEATWYGKDKAVTQLQDYNLAEPCNKRMGKSIAEISAVLMYEYVDFH